MKMRKHVFFISLIALFAITACSSSLMSVGKSSFATPEASKASPAASLMPIIPTPSISSENACIPPLETFAYLTKADKNKPVPGVNLNIYPSSPWQIEAALLALNTTEVSSNSVTSAVRELSLVRFVNNHMELWIKDTFAVQDESPLFVSLFTIYQNDAKETHQVSGEVGENSQIFVRVLLQAEHGTLWGYNTDGLPGYAKTDFPILSKFNDKTQKFEFVKTNWGSKEIGTSFDDIVVFDEGFLWIFVPERGIYNYNIATNKLSLVAKTDLDIQQVALSPDGVFYLFAPFYQSVSDMNRLSVYQFSPETTKVTRVNVLLDPWPRYTSLFVDKANRLWLSNVGWKEPDGIWHQLIPSSIFITNALDSGLDIRWQTPEILLESSDGRLWYRSANGMAWLDPKKEQWCWFTTYQSQIIEDIHNNLWMLIDNKLYFLPLK